MCNVYLNFFRQFYAYLIAFTLNEVAMKRHKEPVKAPTTNGEAQVFVLPPDLLEQLGIQLSSIACPTERIPENSIVCQCK